MNVAPVVYKPRTLTWLTVVSVTLSLWLGASLLLDLVVMPSMYWAGMMADPGFASVGATLFSVFNQVEILCAALVLSGLLVLHQGLHIQVMYPKVALLLATLLLLIPIVYLTCLSPEMSALGLNLHWFEAQEVPEAMTTLHVFYWTLEGMKVAIVGSLLGICYRT